MGLLSKNKIVKKIKKHLVKRVILNNFIINDDYLLYELQLSNFWSVKRKVEIQYIYDDYTQTLPFELNKNTLFIKVPKTLVETTNSRAVIKLFINKKLMWIKESADFAEKNEGFLIENKYFITDLRKNIRLFNKFTEYTFTTDKLLCTQLTSGYNSFQFKSPNAIHEDNHVEIYAFNMNKMRMIEGIVNHGIVQAKDVSVLSHGLWRLFLHMNNQLYPLSLTDQNTESFDTYNHKVDMVSKKNNFYLHVKPHLFDSELITIHKEDATHVSINIRTNATANDYELLMNDIKSNEEFAYPLQRKNNELITNIPMSDLYHNVSKKRFFLKLNGEQPIKYQFQLNASHIDGAGRKFRENIESQLILFSFYKRKDHSLGLKVAKPTLKKMITHIDQYKISGYIGSLEAFVNVKAYLSFEERDSMQSVKVPIENEFEIDLQSLDFLPLKCKEKTIFDLFVEINDEENVVVRKEKIKYKYADYKKDNYYDHKVIEDDHHNQHHFLITTTPFKNVKIETFTIPNNIIVPDDTSLKDNNIWLIGERYNTAQDNGIVFFHWLQKHTNIEAYYVIEADAEDYDKIKDNPNVLIFGSKKHYEIAFKAGVLLGTHDLENILPYKPAKGFFHYENTFKVFLQHGVLGRKNVEYHKKFYELPFHLFIVSSDEEKQDIVMEEMGYEDNEVAVTGLARFDRLIQKEKPKDILLMPTWRDWINTDQRFLESQYYAVYSSLINNEELQNLLNQYDVNLNFYPHYRAQDYFQNNMDALNSRVKFIPFGSKHVQELLIEHALLITDYSSVSFDVLKMNKPIIYYHFDVGDFFKRGILRPIEETFIGRIAHTEEEIIELIEDRLKHHFENYDVDISGVIKYQDRANCERIYRSICEKHQELQVKNKITPL